jgi:hypothetical protein
VRRGGTGCADHGGRFDQQNAARSPDVVRSSRLMPRPPCTPRGVAHSGPGFAGAQRQCAF